MRYRVVGPNAIDGHATGETFEEDMDPVKEARLIAGGHIARETQVEPPKGEEVVAVVRDEDPANDELPEDDGA